MWVFLFQAEDGIRYLVRSRGLGDVYKRQAATIEADGPAARRLADDAAITALACSTGRAVENLSLIHI